jgi:hypothetical protein
MHPQSELSSALRLLLPALALVRLQALLTHCRQFVSLRSVNLSPTLSNLVRTLAHYRNKQDNEPLTVKEFNQCERIVVDLTQMLKTIFRV